MFPKIKADPFRIDIPDAVLVDLRERLARTRFPIEPKNAGWRWGTSLHYMRDVVAHWRDRYDWRHWEARLNRWPHYQASVGGKRVHFMMERGSGTNPLPLLLTHGWPGSVVEFLDVIEPLAHPERFGGDVRDAFTVIAPSLPGYGFSEAPDAPQSHRQIATLWHALMTEVLGCEHYVAQGGDVGAMVTAWLAFDHPAGLDAIHLNLVSMQPDLKHPGTEPLDEDEKAWIKAGEARRAGETGYQQIQGTKFQTLAYGLADSPAGLAAWILEKFHGWTVPGSSEPPPFDLDHLLTNVMLHWLNGANAPTWTYPFAIDPSTRKLPGGSRIEVPTGVLLFPQDLSVPPPDRWIRRVFNLVHRRDAPSGGHFAAFENGPLFTEDVRTFFRRFR
jgi:pimeloyl-ACP methyl ester carboxylesterase